MALSDSLEQIKNFEFSADELQRAGVWPAPIKVIACALLAVLVVAATWWFFVRGLEGDWQRVVAEETRLRSEFESKSFQAANLEPYRRQVAEMEQTFDVLLSRLPEKTQVPDLLEDIDARGSESGLTINRINLEAERDAEYYVELPISVDVDGGYHDLAGFVSGVAGMPRIVTLHDFVIRRRQGSNELNMTVDARTYRYRAGEDE